jgi:hypothetical protein
MIRWLRDMLWLCLILLAGLGWYVHSFFMCPELPRIAARYSAAKAKNEIYAKQIDDRLKELQKDVEERKHSTQVEWALVARLRHERRRLEQIETQITKAGKDSD